jgi:Amidohydrolase family
VAFLNTERFISAFAERDVRWHGTPWVEVLRTKDHNDRRLIDRGAKLMMAHDFGLFGPSAKTSPFFGEWQSGIPDYPYYLGSGHITWMRAAFERALDPMAALQAITRNIAEGYHRLDDIGTVEVGKRADLLVLDADPLAAAENYARIAKVVKDGMIVDRDRLPEKPILTDGVDPAQWQPIVA